jgi:hypothetical protein
VKETNSTVDIGWHGVATDANGVPIASGSLPDYFADQNGDGTFDVGNTDSYNVPYVWYLLHGLYPLYSGVPTEDPDLDALLNYQEYKFGSDPEVSQGVGIWVGSPNGLTGIP